MTTYLSQLTPNAILRARAAVPAGTPYRRAFFAVHCQYPVRGSGISMHVCGKPTFGAAFCQDCVPIVYRKPGAADAI